MSWSVDELEKLPTLCVGQADNLKVDTGTIRVWLSRVDNSISIEQLVNGRWVLVDE